MVVPSRRFSSLRKLPQGQLAHRVQADGGLVQEQQPGPVQQGTAHLRPHALAQAQLPEGRAQQRFQLQGGADLLEPLRPVIARPVIDFPQQIEGIGDGHIPPQLGTLAKHHP